MQDRGIDDQLRQMQDASAIPGAGQPAPIPSMEPLDAPITLASAVDVPEVPRDRDPVSGFMLRKADQ